MQIYEAIVAGLESTGVEAAFGGNGENIASLTIALSKSSKIRTIMARHEQAASFMACGYSMYTGKLGVCFATVGPGAFNLVSGMAVALSDSYPVLAISGYVALEWQGRGAVNDTSGLNRTPDSHAIFAATTKKSFLLTDPADTIDVLEEAINLAFAGRPGPVHIEVPQNLTRPGVRVENYRDLRIRVDPSTPDPADVTDAVTVLADALGAGRSVVLLTGFGAVRSRAGAEVRRFAERFGIPVITTLDGKGILAEDHPLAYGVFSESGHAAAWKAFRRADCVLAVGNSFNQHATFGLRPDLFEGKQLVQVNISGTEIGKQYVPDIGLVADARLGLAAITDALAAKVIQFQPAKSDRRSYQSRHIPHVTGNIHPGRLAQSIGKLLPRDGVVLADAGAHLAWLGYYLELEEGQNFRKTGTYGPMAGNVNGAIGVKLAQPERTVVVGCGDGCYSMAGFELMTAVQNKIAVIWVIFNDDEYKLIKAYQLVTFGTTGLVEFDNPDFATYARACGADGYRVESLADFESVFVRALASGRPTVIDCAITRWAVPHYSSSPRGVLNGAWELLEQRFGKG
jgi:acetolactate synthase-1/2/3 large subunit